MSPKTSTVLAAVLLLAGTRAASAQDAGLTPSPTLPSDTLEANYAPRSEAGPMPDMAPTLPSDTLEATEPVDSFPTDPPDAAAPATPDDSAARHEVLEWMRHHPWMKGPPPPARAVLVRA